MNSNAMKHSAATPKGEMVESRAPLLAGIYCLFAFGPWPLVGIQPRETVKALGSQCDALT